MTSRNIREREIQNKKGHNWQALGSKIIPPCTSESFFVYEYFSKQRKQIARDDAHSLFATDTKLTAFFNGLYLT